MSRWFDGIRWLASLRTSTVRGAAGGSLTKRVEKLSTSSDPGGYASHPATKMLATINHYILDVIPRDPNAPEFRQGNTLGHDNRHWFRAKFLPAVPVVLWPASRPSIRSSFTPGSTTRAACASPDRKADPYVVFKAAIESEGPPSLCGTLASIEGNERTENLTTCRGQLVRYSDHPCTPES